MVFRKNRMKSTLSILMLLMITGVSYSEQQQVYVEIYNPYTTLPEVLSGMVIECLSDSGHGASGMHTLGLPWGTQVIEYWNYVP